MIVKALITAALLVIGIHPHASTDEQQEHHFCCDSTSIDGEGRRTGTGCTYISKAEAAKCESAPLVCDGSWTKQHGVVTCY